MWCDTVYGHDMADDRRGTVIVLISMVRFIFAVIMQVNISICDIVDAWYDSYDVHRNIYTVP